jgi:Undecaprenyl-phosphate glucose phosphotransferase
MNIHQSYTLTSQPGTRRSSRWWTALTRAVFFVGVFLIDVAAIISMSLLTGVIYHLIVHGHEGEPVSFLQVGVLSAIIFAIANLFRDEYALANFYNFRPHVRRSIQLWNVTFVCLLALAFLAQMTVIYSRGWIVLFYGSTICVLLGLRYLFVLATVRGSQAGLLSAQRIFLVGTGRHIDEFITRYRPRRLGMKIVGCHFLAPVEPHAPIQARRLAMAHDLEAAILSARSVEPEAIFLVMPWSDTQTINRCAESFLALPVEIHLGPEQVLDRFENIQLSKHGPMASLQLTRMPLLRLERLEKRAFDLVFAAAGLVLLLPLFVVVAALIKLDSPGPAFFLQRRYGFNQKPFRIIKFRTMATLDDGEVIHQAKRNDPRVTRVGFWLRRWNIDEFPQLLNVLKGDMSLVGPRPHALSHNQDYERRISLYARRHNVKPGITGWAQIHGLRGETDTEEKMTKRVEHDLYYIDNWSPWLDVTILIRTVFSPSTYRHAY